MDGDGETGAPPFVEARLNRGSLSDQGLGNSAALIAAQIQDLLKCDFTIVACGLPFLRRNLVDVFCH